MCVCVYGCVIAMRKIAAALPPPPLYKLKALVFAVATSRFITRVCVYGIQGGALKRWTFDVKIIERHKKYRNRGAIGRSGVRVGHLTTLVTRLENLVTTSRENDIRIYKSIVMIDKLVIKRVVV